METTIERTRTAAEGWISRRTVARVLSASPLLLAACGAGGQSTGSQAQSAAPVRLQFWTNADASMAYAREFSQQNPSVQIDAATIGDYDILAEKALAATAAGTPPNVSILGQRHGITQLADGNALAELEPLLTRQERADFYPQYLEKFTYKGKLRALPFQSSLPVLFWNKEHFKAAGMDPEKPPATWNEHLDAGLKLTKRDASGAATQWGHVMNSAAWYFYTLVWQNGGEVVDKNGQPEFNKQPGIEAAQLWQGWVHKQRMTPGGRRNQAQADFRTGKAAMLQNSQVELPRLRKESPVNFGMAPLPRNKAQAVSIGGNAIGMFKAVGNGRAAAEKGSWQFVNWMTGSDLGPRVVEETGYLPLRKSTVNSEKLKAYFKATPYAALPVDLLQHLRPHPIQRADELMWTELGKILTTLENDASADPRPQLDALAAEIRRLLSR
jgi:sn-glycerol 3-phosphate transport system substrate-binding protein